MSRNRISYNNRKMLTFREGILREFVNEKNGLTSSCRGIATSRAAPGHALWASCNGRAKSVRERRDPAWTARRSRAIKMPRSSRLAGAFRAACAAPCGVERDAMAADDRPDFERVLECVVAIAGAPATRVDAGSAQSVRPS